MNDTTGTFYEAENAIAVLCLEQGAIAVDQAGDRLDPKLFNDIECRRVIEYCISRVADGQFIDVSLIKDIPFRDSCLAIMCGAAIGASLSHLDYHLDELEKSAKRHQLYKVSKLIDDRILQDDVDSLMSTVVDSLFRGEDRDGGTLSARDATIEALDEIEALIADPRGILGFNTGFKRLNKLTQGQQRKKLWVIAGRPGSCKSLFAQVFADAAMKRSDAEVMIFSMEMPRSEWIQRWIANYSGVNVMDAIVAKLPSDLSRIQQAAGHVAKLPMAICDTPALTSSNLIRKIRRAARKGVNYFVIDHIGLLNLIGRELRIELGKMTKALKSLGKELDIHITILIQLNRKAEEAMERDEELTLRHLNEADGPGQDADVVLMLDKERTIHVVKNRGGKAGDMLQVIHLGPTFALKEVEVV